MDQIAVLEPPPGTILGETDYSLPGQISNSNNIRYVNGRPQVIGGWVVVTSGLFGGAQTIVNAFEWTSKNGTNRMAFGHLNGVSVSTSNTDITVGGFTTATHWSFDTWDELLMACSTGAGIYTWDLNIANNLVLVTNAPAASTVALVTETRQMMALGTNEESGGTFNGRCIRWTDVEDNTDWTTLPSNLAGEYILDGTGGAIRAAKKIGPYIAVWTESELYLGRFTGTTDAPWLFERVATGCGALGIDTVCIADGVAYWITYDLRLMMWVPGSVPVEIPGLPVHYITSAGGINADKAAGTKFFAWHNRKFNEIWFHFVVSGQSYPTVGICVSVPSLRTNRPIWFPITMTRSFMYQGVTDVFGSFPAYTGYLKHETVAQGESTSLLTWSFSMIVYLDEGRRRAMVKRVVPDIENQAGNITLTVSEMSYPQGAETTVATKTLAVGDDTSDFRCSGRLLRWQFSGNDGTGSTDTFARFGKTTVEYVATSER